MKRNILIIMISLSIILLLGSSYAILRNRQVGENKYVMNVENLKVEFVDTESNTLTLENMYPMSDEEGANLESVLSFTVENTGDIEARYNVYLEETSTTTEFKNYIRFISNRNTEGCREPKTMGYDKYIDLEARLNPTEKNKYEVKVWLDENAGNEYMTTEGNEKIFKARVVVESNQVDIENTLYNKINADIEKHPGTTVVEDNITYLSGNNDDVNYNYVWYSGKLWRVVVLYNDGTIKLVTEKSITGLVYGANSNYETSWIRQWLNEDFLDTLYNYQNIIETDTLWNATQITASETPIPKTTMVKDPVGLLDIYEFYQAYKNGDIKNGYLINFSKTFLNSYNIDNIWMIYSNSDSYELRSNSSGGPQAYGWGTFPSIVLKKDVIVNGLGSIEDPYRIVGDNLTTQVNQPLNSKISGEYVNFNNQKYRIVSINDRTTKLKSVDYVKDSKGNILKKALSSSIFGEGTTDEYWDFYLNNTWYKSISDDYKKMMVKDIYYLGKIGMKGINSYKNTMCEQQNTDESTKTCKKTDEIWTGYVGLSRIGEMFSNQLLDRKISTSAWMITPFSDIQDYAFSLSAYASIPYFQITNQYAASPTITLSNKVIITSGEGTVDNPFEISCPSCNNT